MDLSPALDAAPSATRIRIDYEAGRLRGSRCMNCGSVSWPARPVCQRCGSAETDEHLLSDRGELVTHTTVWVPRPGLTPPYVLAQVDLADGVRIFAHARELPADVRVPAAVRLVLDADRGAIPPFWFVPVESR